MTVRFYNGRKKVFTITTNNIGRALEMMSEIEDERGVEWTRWKAFN